MSHPSRIWDGAFCAIGKHGPLNGAKVETLDAPSMSNGSAVF